MKGGVIYIATLVGLLLAGFAQAGDVASSEANGQLGVGTQPAAGTEVPNYEPSSASSNPVAAGIIIWIFIAIGIAAIWGWITAMYRQWMKRRHFKIGQPVHIKFTAKQIRELKENVRNIIEEQRREMGFPYIDEEDSKKRLPDWVKR